MKKFICMAGFLGALSSPAYAYFQCDYEFKVMGRDFATWIQIETLNGQESLVFREAGTREGQSEGVIMSGRVTEKKNTRIGALVRAEITDNGETTKLTIVLPDVFPGRGRLDWGDNPNQNETLKECRRK